MGYPRLTHEERMAKMRERMKEMGIDYEQLAAEASEAEAKRLRDIPPYYTLFYRLGAAEITQRFASSLYTACRSADKLAQSGEASEITVKITNRDGHPVAYTPR